MAVLEAMAVSEATTSSGTKGELCPGKGVMQVEGHAAPSVVMRERVSVPLLAANRTTSNIPSPSPERDVDAVSSAAAAAAERAKAEAFAQADAEIDDELTPLERYLLRSGEILESYTVESRVLGTNIPPKPSRGAA